MGMSRIRRFGAIAFVAGLVAVVVQMPVGAAISDSSRLPRKTSRPALIVMDASSGTFTASPGADRITLSGLSPEARASLRPRGTAGTSILPSSQAVTILADTPSVEAIVRVPGVPKDSNAVAMKLSGLALSDQGVLSADARPRDHAGAALLAGNAAGLDKALPATFGAATIAAADPNAPVNAAGVVGSVQGSGYKLKVTVVSSFPAGKKLRLDPRPEGQCVNAPWEETETKAPPSSFAFDVGVINEGACAAAQTFFEYDIDVREKNGNLLAQALLEVHQTGPRLFSIDCHRRGNPIYCNTAGGFELRVEIKP
jgi:hypothetical protein